MKRLFAAALVTLAWTTEVPAEEPQASCTGFAWPMEREAQLFATDTGAIASGTTFDAMPTTAIHLTLVPQADANYPVKRERPPKKADSKGGWITLPAPSAPGIYQVTLNSEGWLDATQSGAVLTSTAFASDRQCKSMRKSIRFDLKAEPVTLQLSDVPVGEVTLTILPASS